MSEYLTLKWGTLKGWKLETDASKDAMKLMIENRFLSAMAQHDSPEQKLAICNLIDVIDGPITSDWSGETLTREEAKKYVMEYGR